MRVYWGPAGDDALDLSRRVLGRTQAQIIFKDHFGAYSVYFLRVVLYVMVTSLFKFMVHFYRFSCLDFQLTR
jgi:hypothetical protein